MTDIQFNMMLTLLLQKDGLLTSSNRQQIIAEIMSITEGYEKKYPMAINKIEFIRDIAEKLKHKTVESTLIDIFGVDKYRIYSDLVDNVDKNISVMLLEDYRNQLNYLYRHLIPEKYAADIGKIIQDITDHSYSSVSELVEAFENKIARIHLDIINASRNADINKTNHLDLSDEESLEKLFASMKEHYSNTDNYVPTGYKKLDYFFRGGMERQRLYIFAGEPGVGKSTILANIFNNWSKNSQEDGLFVYITLENAINETMVRYLCITGDKESLDVVQDIRDKDPKEMVKQVGKQNPKLYFSYYPANSINVEMITTILNKIKLERNKPIKGLVVDYLNLLSTADDMEVRHELAAISQGLKSIANLFCIPVVTATQLNKSSYDISASKVSNKNITESGGIVHHADAIILVARNKKTLVAGKAEDDEELDDNTDDGIEDQYITMKIGKNRNGPLGSIKALFTKTFKIYEVDKNNNIIDDSYESNKKANEMAMKLNQEVVRSASILDTPNNLGYNNSQDASDDDGFEF